MERQQSEPFNFNLYVREVKHQSKGKTELENSPPLPVIEALHQSVAKKRCVLLVGRPGSGKTKALLRYLLELVEQAKDDPSARIPILVRLKDYQTSSDRKHSGIVHLIRKELVCLEIEEIERYLFLEQKFLLLIDGLNESTSLELRKDLQQFLDSCHKRQIPIVFTTRLLGYRDLGIETQLEIQPILPEERQRFLDERVSPAKRQQLQRWLDRARQSDYTPFVMWMLAEICEQVNSSSQLDNFSLGEAFREFVRLYQDKLYEEGRISDEDCEAWISKLKHLASAMLLDATSENFLIPRRRAINILGSEASLNNLIQHHLLTERRDDKKIEFCHQLLQEYYAAKWLLDRLPELSDEQLKYYFLNYLKWTEAIGLMMGLPDVTEKQALAIVELALDKVDLRLGARLAGEVKPPLQEQTVTLIRTQKVPELLKVHLLGATRSVYAIPDLVHALQQHENLILSTDAAMMLWDLGSPLLVDELLNLLDHNSYIVRANAAFAALGLRGIDNDKIISRLAEALQNENEHEYFRESAASTLSALGNPKAIPALISVLQNSPVRVREKAVEGLRDLSDQTAFEPLLEIALEDQPLYIQWCAAHALGRIDAKTAMQKLLEAIESGNYEIRERAADAIEHLESEEVIPILVELLENHEKYRYSYIHSIAAKGLEKIGTATAVQSLIQALQHPDFEVRRSVISALGNLGDQTAIPELTTMLEDQNPDVREEVAFALGKLGSEDAIPELIKSFVEKQNRMVRGRTGVAAARLLSNLGDKEAIPCLLKAVKDPTFQNSRDCGVVLDALGKLGCEEIIPELFKRLEEDRAWVQSEVIDGLASLNTQVVRSQLCKLLKHSDRELRINAAQVLSKLGDVTTIEHLRKALEDPDLEVRLHVMDALEALCDVASLPRLWQMQLIEENNTSFLSTIKSIQTGDRCQFYNYTIAKSTPPPAMQPFIS